MLILLILFSVVFVFLNFSCVNNFHNVESKLRKAFIYTLLFISVFVAVSTELFNLFGCITTTGIAIAWSALLLTSFVNWWRWGKHIPSFRITNPLTIFEKILFCSIAFIFLITFITALTSYPNNWDSMTYHLARVMHWIQNKNLEHYPTQISRQDSQPPLAEYFMLHFRLLSANDRLANLVQWFSMAGSVITVSLIVKEIGKNRQTQLLSAFICATIPMGILQSNSTQNDYLLGLFIVCCLWFVVRLIRYNCRHRDILLLIISAALAILTKGTSFIFLLPIALIAISILIWKLKLRSLVYLPIAFIILLCICGPHAYRNYNSFNSPTGPEYELTNDVISLNGFISNASKNIAMHLKTPYPNVNTAIEESVGSIHNKIGVDLNSRKYQWPYSSPFQVQKFSYQEDSAGNLLHVLIFIICSFVWLLNKPLRKNKWILFMFLINALLFITFCFVLKWQIWHCRLHLPMFICGSIFIGLVISEMRLSFKYVMFVLFLVSGFLFLVYNESRPILKEKNIFNTIRNEQYFKTNPSLQKPFEEIVQLIHQNNFHSIGWISGGDTWEYPMWVMLDDIEDLRMENVSVTSETMAIEANEKYQSFIPDALIISRFETDIPNYTYKNQDYRLIYKMNGWAVYKR